jgi:hypothetical protein
LTKKKKKLEDPISMEKKLNVEAYICHPNYNRKPS